MTDTDRALIVSFILSITYVGSVLIFGNPVAALIILLVCILMGQLIANFINKS